MKKLFLILAISSLIIFLLISISGKSPEKDSTDLNKLQVTASFYPLYFFANAIGGDKAEVRNITPAGVEPHDYEPSPRDLVVIENSDLLIFNGGTLESWRDKEITRLRGKPVAIVIAGEGLTFTETEAGGGKILDPHVWLSPPLAQQQVAKILEGFIKADPANESYYRDNAAKLKQKLVQLDNNFRSGLAQCQKNDIFTAHEAFGYLAATYSFEQFAVTGISPDAEPSVRQLTEITKLAKQDNIKYIFFESLLSPKLSETIAGEVGAQILVLDPVEGISSEAMQNGADYFSIMQENLANLRLAMECR